MIAAETNPLIERLAKRYAAQLSNNTARYLAGAFTYEEFHLRQARLMRLVGTRADLDAQVRELVRLQETA